MSHSLAVEARGVGVALGSRRHRRDILRDLDIHLPTGSVTGLFGPSGCGKTTLMRTLAGLQRHTGEVTVLGHPAGAAALRGRVGYVTQSPSLYPELSVDENLAYFARLAGGRATGVVEKLGLAEVRRQPVAELSGGQRGRASLGAALVGDPELLIMDEPTVADPVIRAQLGHLPRAADEGRTLLAPVTFGGGGPRPACSCAAGGHLAGTPADLSPVPAPPVSRTPSSPSSGRPTQSHALLATTAASCATPRRSCRQHPARRPVALLTLFHYIYDGNPQLRLRRSSYDRHPAAVADVHRLR